MLLFKSVHRPAFLEAALVAVVIDLCWNWVHPAALPQRHAGALLLGSAVCSALAHAGVFGMLPLDGALVCVVPPSRRYHTAWRTRCEALRVLPPCAACRENNHPT